MRKLWIPLLLLGVLVPRIYLLFKFRSALIESDEAVVGLMARHILQGEIPAFYWGQPYMGTLEVFVVALLFALFGATPLMLKMASLLLFLIFLVAHYFLALRASGRRVAILATLLVAVSPSFLTVWSLKSRGGYMVLLILGTLLLLTTSRMLERSVRIGDAVLFGVIAGAAWWTHPLALVYIVPATAVLLLKHERELISRHGVALVGGFLSGSFPFWVYNLRHSWESLRVAGARQTEIPQDLLAFAKTGLPIVLGARHNWNGPPFLPFATAIVLAVFLISLAVVAWRWLWKSPTFLVQGKHLLLVFALSFPILFSVSGFAWFINEPRYLLPLYSAIYILIFSATGSAKAQTMVFSILIGLNLFGNFRTSREDFLGYTNVESNQALVDFLQGCHLDRIYAPYWIAYRLTFETAEGIVCTPPNGDVVRYEPYRRRVEVAPHAAYVRLNASRYEGLHAPVTPPADFVGTRIGNYEVFIPKGLDCSSARKNVSAY